MFQGPKTNAQSWGGKNKTKLREWSSGRSQTVIQSFVAAALVHRAVALEDETVGGWDCISNITGDQRARWTTPSHITRAAVAEPSGDLPREQFSQGKVT